MQILVTGGYGFIGGRLAQKLATIGNKVYIGTRDIHRQHDNILGTKIVYTEWEKPESLVKLCSGMDVVIHTAGMNARDCESDPVSAHAFNGKVTGELAKAAVSVGVKQFIYCSTVHVYSSPLTGLISEEHPTSNNHPYATSHLAGEKALFGSIHGSDIKAQVLRLSNVYGVPTDKEVKCWELLVNDLCKQISEKHELRLYTSGTQFRDFISMEEVCEIVQCLCSENQQHKRNEIFNVSSGNSQTVLEMAHIAQSRAKEILGFVPVLVMPESKVINESDNHSLKVSNNKIRQCCNFSPVNPVDELDRLLAFCQQNFS
jgi:UDP-glucose 4-epimerase